MKSFNNNYEFFSDIFYLIASEHTYKDLDFLDYVFISDDIRKLIIFYEDI